MNNKNGKSNKLGTTLKVIAGIGALGFLAYKLFNDKNENKIKDELNEEMNYKFQKKFNLTEQEMDFIHRKLEKEFTCPISLELMANPVNTICGHSFEECNIKEWIKKKNFCPLCNKSIKENNIFPNYSLRAIIEREVKKLKKEFRNEKKLINNF